MNYYFSRTLQCSFDDAVRRTTDALSKAGFGIITEIDLKAQYTLLSQVPDKGREVECVNHTHLPKYSAGLDPFRR